MAINFKIRVTNNHASTDKWFYAYVGYGNGTNSSSYVLVGTGATSKSGGTSVSSATISSSVLGSSTSLYLYASDAEVTLGSSSSFSSSQSAGIHGPDKRPNASGTDVYMMENSGNATAYIHITYPDGSESFGWGSWSQYKSDGTAGSPGTGTAVDASFSGHPTVTMPTNTTAGQGTLKLVFAEKPYAANTNSNVGISNLEDFDKDHFSSSFLQYKYTCNSSGDVEAGQYNACNGALGGSSIPSLAVDSVAYSTTSVTDDTITITFTYSGTANGKERVSISMNGITNGIWDANGNKYHGVSSNIPDSSYPSSSGMLSFSEDASSGGTIKMAIKPGQINISSSNNTAASADALAADKFIVYENANTDNRIMTAQQLADGLGLILNKGIAVDTNKFTVADSTGNTAIAGTLAVTGDTSVATFDSSGATTLASGGGAVNISKSGVMTTIKGTLNADEAVTFDGALDVAGDTSVATFDSSGATSLATGGGAVNISKSGVMTTIKGTLNADEAVTFDGALDVAGDTSVATFDSSGATSLATGGGAVNISKSGVMTTVKGTFNVDEAVTLDAALDVAGDTSVATFDSSGATTLASGGGAVNISKSGVATTVNGTFNVDEAATFDSTLGAADTISITKASGTGLSVTANATIGGNLTVTGNLDVDGTLTTIDTNNLVVKDKLIKLGQGYTGSAMDLGLLFTQGDGSATDKANKALIWDTSANSAAGEFAFIACDDEDGSTDGNVTISGYAKLRAGDLAIGSDKLTVAASSGNTAIAGTLDVTGDTSVTTFDSSGATTLASGGGAVNISKSGVMTTVKGTFNVDEAVTLDGALDVAGDTSVATFDSSGATTLASGGGAVNISKSGVMTTIKGTLNADEAVTFDGALDVAGDTSVATFDSSGATTLASGGGAVNISKSGVMTTVKGTLNVDEAVTLDGALDVAGDTSVATFDSSGATTLASGGGAVNISKSGVMTTVKGTLNVDEAVTLDAALNVTGDTSVSTFDSSGATSLATGGGVVAIASSGVMTTVKGTLNVDEAVTLDTTLGVTGAATFSGAVVLGSAAQEDVQDYVATPTQVHFTKSGSTNYGSLASDGADPSGKVVAMDSATHKVCTLNSAIGLPMSIMGLQVYKNGLLLSSDSLTTTGHQYTYDSSAKTVTLVEAIADDDLITICFIRNA